MSIRDFAQSVLNAKWTGASPRDWNRLLAEHGYHSVPVSTNDGYLAVNDWCNQHIGEDHYVWTGSSYWFETEAAAVLFSLKWL